MAALQSSDLNIKQTVCACLKQGSKNIRDPSKTILCEKIGNKKKNLVSSYNNELYVDFYDLVYAPNFILIGQLFHIVPT